MEGTSSTEAAPGAGLTDKFDSYIAKVTSALESASKNHNALAQMNKSATVFYKALRTRLNSVAIQTNAVQERSNNAVPSRDDVDAIWERTLRLEAVVTALNNYCVRLEAELLDTEN